LKCATSITKTKVAKVRAKNLWHSRSQTYRDATMWMSVLLALEQGWWTYSLSRATLSVIAEQAGHITF